MSPGKAGCRIRRQDQSPSSVSALSLNGRLAGLQLDRGRLADPEARTAIALRPDRFPPPAIVKIPGYRLPQPALEVAQRPPIELAPDLCGVDRVAAVVPRAVGNERDQPR